MSIYDTLNPKQKEAVDEMIKNASKCALDMVADIELGKIMQKYNKK